MDDRILDEKNYARQIADTRGGIILLHKALCPHCQNMRKVIAKFMAAVGEEVSLMLMDSEENPEALKALNVERVPTIMIVKNGQVAATKTGLMNPRELAALYRSA